MQAVRVHEFGGPEQLRYEEVALPEPGPGQALVKIEAIGVKAAYRWARRRCRLRFGWQGTFDK